MSSLTIKPMTTGTLQITIEDSDGTPWPSGTGDAKIYLPSGKLVAENVTVTFQGSGVFDLTIDAGWSTDANGYGIEGKFTAEFEVTFGTQTVTERVCYTCLWECD